MLELSATSKSITLFQLSDSVPYSSLPTYIQLEQCLFATVCLRYRGRNVIQHYACCLMLWVFRYFKELFKFISYNLRLLALLPCQCILLCVTSLNQLGQLGLRFSGCKELISPTKIKSNVSIYQIFFQLFLNYQCLQGVQKVYLQV